MKRRVEIYVMVAIIGLAVIAQGMLINKMHYTGKMREIRRGIK